MTLWQSGMNHGPKSPWIGKFIMIVREKRRDQSAGTSTEKTQER